LNVWQVGDDGGRVNHHDVKNEYRCAVYSKRRRRRRRRRKKAREKEQSKDFRGGDT
jgi:hypothetical protein